MKRLQSLASRLTFPSLLVAFAALLPGCTVETMTVQLGWGTANTTCFEAGVTSMDYVLVDSNGATVQTGSNLNCGDLQFSSLLIDDYELDIYGFNAAGNETYAATCTGVFFEGQSVTHLCTVPPSGDPLLVAVQWDLSETTSFVPGTCTEAGVFDYDVLLRDGATVVSSSVEVRCTNGNLVLDFGSQPSGSYSLEVTGYADDGNAYWFGNCTVSPSPSGQSVCNAVDNG